MQLSSRDVVCIIQTKSSCSGYVLIFKTETLCIKIRPKRTSIFHLPRVASCSFHQLLEWKWKCPLCFVFFLVTYMPLNEAPQSESLYSLWTMIKHVRNSELEVTPPHLGRASDIFHSRLVFSRLRRACHGVEGEGVKDSWHWHTCSAFLRELTVKILQRGG